MLNYEFFFIALTIAFCLHATYTDLKYRKIRNLCSYGLIYAGLVAQALFLIQGKITVSTLISISLGGGIVALLLYWLNILAPGDAKLFLGISLALPSFLFQNPTGNILFPPIVIAINIFAFYFFGMSIYMLFKSSTSQKVQTITTAIKRENLAKSVESFFRFFSLGVIISAVWNRFPILNSLQLAGFLRMVTVLVLFFFLKKFVSKLKGDELLSPLFFTSAAALMIVSPPLWGALGKALLWYFTIYSLVITFLLNLAHLLFSKEMQIAELKEGMMPDETILEIQDSSGSISYVKRNSKDRDEQMDERANIVVNPTIGALRGDHIKTLKQLAESGHFISFGNSLRVQETIPFAPIILIGVIITIVSKGPFYLKVLPFVMRMISRG